MYYIHKQGFILKNGKLEKKYNVQMKKNNEGYNITGYDNNKVINKHVRFINKSQLNVKKINNKKKKITKKKK